MSGPTLVVLAAGMGSRYGGLKQIDPIDPQGHLIIDFSVYDAIRAGFSKVVFVIKHAIEDDFKASVGDRLSKIIKVEYVYQELEKLPAGYSVPDGRVKPWGTAHALLCCKDVIDGPFAVINSDDYYGPTAYRKLFGHLTRTDCDDEYGICLIGYRLANTLTDKGSVARGVCVVENGKLKKIDERTKIFKDGEGGKFTEDDGATFTPLPGDTPVSMNMWGMHAPFIAQLEKRFPAFLDKALAENPLKSEFFLPVTVDDMLRDGQASVDVLTTPDKWYGVTYHEDKPTVMAGIQALKEKGIYPEKLWK